MLKIPTPFAGILFIGDPHCSSENPGRRQDNYLNSCIDKLAQASKICHEHNLYPVILGDLIHRNNESSNRLNFRLSQVLGTFPAVPLDLEGNHGKSKFHYSEDDMIVTLALNNRIIVLDEDTNRVVFENLGGKSVELFAFPYKSEFPSKVQSNCDVAIGISHHDLMFGPGYPGAVEPTAVEGLSFVVNGHIHKTYPSKIVGNTTWFCPGNIERLSIDVVDHKPAVWKWTPAEAGTAPLLEPLYLSCDAVFDLAGHQVAQATANQALADMQAQTTFAPMLALAEQADNQADKTSDMEILKEDLESLIQTVNPSELAIATLKALLQEVAQQESSAPS